MVGGVQGGEDMFHLQRTAGTKWRGGFSGLGGGQDPAGTEARVGRVLRPWGGWPEQPSLGSGQGQVGLAQGPTGMESLAVAVWKQLLWASRVRL